MSDREGPHAQPSEIAELPAEQGLDERTLALWRLAAAQAADNSDTLKLPSAKREQERDVPLLPRPRHIAELNAEGEANADYLLVDELGRGGMGVVYLARQTALGREVALKQHQSSSSRNESFLQFTAEAAVIGELDHPNIVPIHELMTNTDGQLFYSMKKIQGVPWNLVMDAETLERNLEIFLQVCDAVAFAHAHSLIHRDIKPHNVMLGDYGEVFLVDWGLAARVGTSGGIETDGSRSPIGGTAAYMAPEMALGELDRVSFTSDVYLLGAVLFKIITGSAPHRGDTVMACLYAASINQIVEHEDDDELMEIAQRALDTDPGHRYPDVRSLQQAVREYLSHRESVTLSRRADISLVAAQLDANYEEFQRAIFGFEQALSLWSENEHAAKGLGVARLSYARTAMDREDLDLAASLLPTGDEAANELGHEIARRRSRRDHRRRRIRVLSRTAQLLGVLLVAILVSAVVLVTRERNRVVQAEGRASTQRDLALHTLDTLVFEVDKRLEHRPAMHRLRETLLNEAISGLNRVVESLPEGGSLDHRLITAHASIARIYFVSRRNQEALEHQHKVLEILRQRQAQGEAVDAADLAAAYTQLGDILHNYRMGDLEAADEAYQKALTHLRPTAETQHEARLSLVALYQSLGDVSFDRQRIDEAADWYSTAAEACEELVAIDPTEPDVRLALVNTTSRQGDVAFERGDYERAEELFDRAARRGRELLEGQEDNREVRRVVALAITSQADCATRSDDVDTAQQLYEAARGEFERLIQGDSTDGQLQRDLLVVRWSQGRLNEGLAHYETARRHYLAALAIAERLLQGNPDNAEARRDLMLCHHRVGNVALELGHTNTAAEHYDRGFDLATGLAEDRPDNLFAQADLVAASTKLADVAYARGNCEAALESWDAALEILHSLEAEGRISPESRFYPWIEAIEDNASRCQR